jgi:hypothetical protein
MTKPFGFPRRRLVTAVLVTGLLMVPLAIFGGPAFAHTASALHQYVQPSSSQYQYDPSSAQYQYQPGTLFPHRVKVCHHTHSRKHPWHMITIGDKATAAHLRHGDRMGSCSGHAKHNGKSASADSQSQVSQSSQRDDDDDDNGKGGHGKSNKHKGHHGRS